MPYHPVEGKKIQGELENIMNQFELKTKGTPKTETINGSNIEVIKYQFSKGSFLNKSIVEVTINKGDFISNVRFATNKGDKSIFNQNIETAIKSHGWSIPSYLADVPQEYISRIPTEYLAPEYVRGD